MTPHEEFAAEVHRRLLLIKGIPPDPLETLKQTVRELALEWMQSCPEKLAAVLAENVVMQQMPMVRK